MEINTFVIAVIYCYGNKDKNFKAFKFRYVTIHFRWIKHVDSFTVILTEFMRAGAKLKQISVDPRPSTSVISLHVQFFRIIQN